MAPRGAAVTRARLRCAKCEARTFYVVVHVGPPDVYVTECTNCGDIESLERVARREERQIATRGDERREREARR